GFLILAGDNLHTLLPNMKMEFHGLVIGGKQSFVLLIALVMMPTLWINDMTTLSCVCNWSFTISGHNWLNTLVGDR
ncbi:hypothetical protein PSY31_23500, partial [Shigella flexneri]|nr:hypothetical protein [Shigella flexneri]